MTCHHKHGAGPRRIGKMVVLFILSLTATTAAAPAAPGVAKASNQTSSSSCVDVNFNVTEYRKSKDVRIDRGSFADIPSSGQKRPEKVVLSNAWLFDSYRSEETLLMSNTTAALPTSEEPLIISLRSAKDPTPSIKNVFFITADRTYPPAASVSLTYAVCGAANSSVRFDAIAADGESVVSTKTEQVPDQSTCDRNRARALAWYERQTVTLSAEAAEGIVQGEISDDGESMEMDAQGGAASAEDKIAGVRIVFQPSDSCPSSQAPSPADCASAFAVVAVSFDCADSAEKRRCRH